MQSRLILLSLVLTFLSIHPQNSAIASEKNTLKPVVQKHLTIVTEEWAPYNYHGPKGVQGFSVEIVQAMMSHLGIKGSIKLLPGARGERLLSKGKRVMNFSLFRSKAREKQYKWIGPISEESIYFYQHRDTQQKFHSLSQARSAIAVSSLHKGLVYDALKNNGFKNLIKSTEISSVIQQLLKKKVELAIGVTPLGMSHYLRELGVDATAVIKTPIKLLSFPLYIACSRDIPDTEIQQWSEALNAIKESGLFEKTYNTYLKP